MEAETAKVLARLMAAGLAIAFGAIGPGLGIGRGGCYLRFDRGDPVDFRGLIFFRGRTRQWKVKV
ncbi:MAG: hypothetical protein NT009_02355 [Proteobacteria bacterium]|nr:hypothetical protein [Pseudomonadota bacterium]